MTLHPDALVYDSWRDVPEDVWTWDKFTPYEMRCRGTGKVVIIPECMDRLMSLRLAFSYPMIITSAYRSPDYNNRVSSTGFTGPHTTAQAYDIQVYGYRAYRLEGLAFTHGYTGIGKKQFGAYNKRFIHIDNLGEEPNQPRPWSWTYPK